MFETHFKSTFVLACFFITTWGWVAWNAFLDSVYAKSPSGPYAIRDSFTQTFGRDATWWATLFVVLAFLGLMELVGKTVHRNLHVAGCWQWPPWKGGGLSENLEEWDLEVWQEMEQDPAMKERLRNMARDGDDEDQTDEVAAVQEKSSLLDHVKNLKRMIPKKATA